MHENEHAAALHADALYNLTQDRRAGLTGRAGTASARPTSRSGTCARGCRCRPLPTPRAGTR